MPDIESEKDKPVAGRPAIYPDRKRTSWEISPDLLNEIDNRRGSESRAIYVERELRKLYNMPPLGSKNEGKQGSYDYSKDC